MAKPYRVQPQQPQQQHNIFYSNKESSNHLAARHCLAEKRIASLEASVSGLWLVDLERLPSAPQRFTIQQQQLQIHYSQL